VWGNPEKCASFPLVPWSNRVRDGVLRFRGRTWTLAHNAADGTAIHGAALGYTWRVVDRTAGRVELELDTRGLVGVNFPWVFRSRLVYELDGAALRVTTTLENVDTEPFPAGFGHHPYFQRRLTPAASSARVVAPEELVDADAVTVDGGATLSTAGVPAPAQDAVLHVPFDRGYALTAGMASAAAGDVPARADYREPRPVGNAFVDDVLTDRRDGEPVTWTYPDSGVRVRLDADDVYGHLVVYVPRRRAYFAVEPVTHVNSGVELHEAGVPGTGVFVLEPGESRSGSFTLTVERA
jgi:aldose 1-epimerase